MGTTHNTITMVIYFVIYSGLTLMGTTHDTMTMSLYLPNLSTQV